MHLTVFCEPIHRRYRASICSISFCFVVACWAGIIIVPFYLAYGSSNFWLKQNVLYAQPTVRFQYDLLFVAQGTSASQTNAFTTWVWDTIPEIRTVYEPFLRAPIVRSWYIDENNDNVPDIWTVTVQMPLEEGDKVYQVDAVGFFTYELTGAAPLSMDAMAYINYASPIPGKGFNMECDAILNQKQALSVQQAYTSDDLTISRVAPASLYPNLVQTLVSSYARRNFTMELTNTYKVWNTISAMDQFAVVSNSFLLNFTMRIPVDAIVYTPAAPEVLKVAWIQYFCIGIIFYVLFYLLQMFVFSNQVLETNVQSQKTRSSPTF